MTFWVIAGLLTLAAVLILLWPLLCTTSEQEVAGGDRQRRIYRDQLREIEHDHRTGRLADEDRSAAEIEIQRRILAAPAATPARTSRSGRFLAAIILVLLIPTGTAVLYGQLGKPSLPAQPLAERSRAIDSRDSAAPLSELPNLVAQIEERLAETPDDPVGWAALGRTTLAMRDFPKAVEAFRRGLLLAPDNPTMLAGYGEALAMTAGGIVAADSESAFRQALVLQPDAAGPRFYLGLAAYQRGKYQTALERWRALEADTPPGAAWETLLKQYIAVAADQAGIDPGAGRTTAEPPPGETQPPRRSADPGQSDAQQAMILSMVERLATRLKTQPEDPEGWLRLARSYSVLGRENEARDALAQAAALTPDRIDILTAYAQALMPAGVPERDMPPAFRAVIRQILQLDPDLPFALYYGGAIAAFDDDKADARYFWTRLLDQMGPDHPERNSLEQRLDGLDGG